MSAGAWPDRLLNIQPGDLLHIAGRSFMVQSREGSGWGTTLMLVTTRIFMSQIGPTNRLKITIEELMGKLITVRRRIDTKV